MLKVVLTGGIGSGKSTVAHLFSQLGVPIIDADEIAHQLTQPNMEATNQIRKHFGEDVMNGSSLDRAQLRKRVFDSPSEKQWLEALLHPLILKEIERLIQIYSTPYCIIVIPLLTTKNSYPFIDRVLTVDIPESVQLERVKDRNIPPDTLQKIISSQLSREKRLELADDVIYNEGSLADLEEAVNQLHSQYLFSNTSSETSPPKR